jgi:hypothetical protein
VLYPKHLNEQNQKDDETLSHYRDMEVELAFPIDNPNNDLKTLDPKLTLKDLDEVKQIAGGQKDVPDDDVTEQMTTWTKQHRQS